MLKIDNVMIPQEGWEAAIRGMRNPMNSWEKSDSCFPRDGEWHDICGNSGPANPEDDALDCADVGPSDFKLMMNLNKGGTEESKYRRMIVVYLDITAPLYWWKEFDTYKVGTVANSCSTMHKIHAKEFTIEDFSTEHLDAFSLKMLENSICRLNLNREEFVNWREDDPTAALRKDYWWQMIQLLPTSYNQRRTVMLNYEVLAQIYRQRRHHKLDEWHTVCDWIETLPYRKIITGEKEAD